MRTRRVYISRIWGEETPGRIASKFCLVIGTQDVITCIKFGDDRLRGFWSAGCQSSPFPIQTFDVVLTTVLRYRVHCDAKQLQFSCSLYTCHGDTHIQNSKNHKNGPCLVCVFAMWSFSLVAACVYVLHLCTCVQLRRPIKADFLQRVSIACYAERCISYSKSVRLSVRLSVTRWH